MVDTKRAVIATAVILMVAVGSIPSTAIAQSQVSTSSLSLGYPGEVAVNPSTGSIYHSGYDGSNMRVAGYSSGLNQEWTDTPASAGGYGVAYSSVDDSVYAADTDVVYRYSSDGTAQSNINLGADMRSDVAIDPDTGDQYYGSVGTSDVIKKFDSNGDELWSFTTGSAYSNRIAYNQEHGYVFAVGSGDGPTNRVYALDSDGNEIWTNTNISESDVATDGDRVYVAGGGEISILDAQTGDLIKSVPSSVGSRRVAYHDGIIYVGGGSGIAAIDESDGSEYWTEATGIVEDIVVDDTGATNGQNNVAVIYADRDTLYKTVTDQPAGEEYTLSGTVRDANTNDAIRNATVTVANETGSQVEQTATNDVGSYSVQLVNGTYNVTVSKQDYSQQTEQVTIAGSGETTNFDLSQFNQSIELDTKRYLEHGQEAEYSVSVTVGGDRQNVTGEASVTSSNESVVTVDSQRFNIVATSNIQVNDRTTVTAEWADGEGNVYTTSQNVTVANATVENLQILPTWTKTSASIGDNTIQAIIVATIIAAAAAIFAGSFAGIAAHTLIMVAGWLMGYVGNGMIIVSFLFAIFVGLNVATNFQPIMNPRG